MGGTFIFSLQNVQGSYLHIQGDLFAVDRIIYGQLRPEDIQYYIVFHEN